MENMYIIKACGLFLLLRYVSSLEFEPYCIDGKKIYLVIKFIKSDI